MGEQGKTVTARGLTTAARFAVLAGLLLAAMASTAKAQPFSVAGSMPSTWGWVQRCKPLPPALYVATMACDSSRGRTVLFGGLKTGQVAVNETWEWDGTEWEKKIPATSPSVRLSHSMVFDSARRRIVLFGGGNDAWMNVRYNQTWEYDGTNWAQIATANSPAARDGNTMMAYDSRRRRTVLFGGGISNSAAGGDTWEYDGTNWTQRVPATAPRARSSPMMAFDAARSRVVLYGGYVYGVGTNNETWEYDGTNWAQRTPVSAPPTRTWAGIAYAASSRHVVLWGGNPGSGVLGDMWEWDGTNWRQTTQVSPPAGRFTPGLAYDTFRDRLVLYGGSKQAGQATGNTETWEYDGTNWSQRTVNGTPTAPASRAGHALAYDPARGQTVLFGGTAPTAVNDTWLWNGRTWAQASPTSSPPARFAHCLAYDWSSNRVALVGGTTDSSTGLTDMWFWNGAGWSSVAPQTPPPGRFWTALASRSSSASLLLFGGGPGTPTDTWQWDGSNWSQQSAATAPPGRREFSLVFDSRRDRCVAFGGSGGLSDTWEWTGTDWLLATPGTAPSERYSHGAAYDASSRRTILFGGRPAGTESYSTETWEYDGTNWVKASPGTSPSGRGSPLAYDSGRRCIVLFGGYGGSRLGDTWELPSNRPPSVTAAAGPVGAKTGQTVTLSATFSDPDGDTPTWRWLQTYGPPVALQGAASATATFSTTIATSYGFEAIASDGHEGHAYALGTVEVAAGAVGPNRQPGNVTVSSSSARIAPAGTVGLTAACSDPDGDPLGYAWTVVSQPAGADFTLAEASAATATFSATTPGGYTLRCTVTDGRGGSSASSASITVAAAGGGAFSVAGSVPGAWGWVQRGTAQFAARWGHAIAFDSVRGVTVLFGGFTGGARLNDTWEWDGASWRLASAATAPSARTEFGMVFDPWQSRTVLFGGHDGSTYLNDTWEWNGTTWYRHVPSASPGARSGHGLAYDAARRRVVLFGGQGSSGAFGDTWEWNGTTWLQRLPASSPSARTVGAMGYDSSRQVIVQFGGRIPTSSNVEGDTWEWDGTTWAQRSPVHVPPSRQWADGAYDVARRRFVMFAGNRPGYDINDTWEWDGTDWSQLSPASAPPIRHSHRTVYNSIRNRIMLVAGVGSHALNDTWEYDGTNWKLVSAPVTSPPGQRWFGFDYHEATRKTVAFGLSGQKTYEWDGLAWTQAAPATSPPYRTKTASAYDSSRGRSVLFGGDTDYLQFIGDTWEWDGTGWLSVATPAAPSLRGLHALAYDPARGQTVLFGGGQAPPTVLSDTWVFDGSSWTRKVPDHSPSARVIHGLAHDEARERTVLFGGGLYNGTFDDQTWEWDGSDWTQRSPGVSPSARGEHAMTYDPVRRRVLLFGGATSGFTSKLSDTWAFDGNHWLQLPTATAPPARANLPMAYDTVRQRAVIFGGETIAGYTTDTWELPSNRPPTVAATVSPVTATAGQTVTLAASFTDPDGDTPAWRWIQTYGPPVALQGANSAVATFSTTLGGAYGFQVVADDGHEGYAYAHGEVNVPANRPPTGVNPISAVNWVLPGTTVPLTATATDPDGDPVSFAWSVGSQPAGGDGVLAAASGVTNNFRAIRSGTYAIVLTASDGRGGVTTAVRNLTFDTNPTVDAGPDRVVQPGERVTLAALAADADGDPLTFTWQQFRGPSVALETPTAASVSFVVPLAGSYGFAVSVSDPSGALVQDSVNLTATIPQQPDLLATAVASGTSQVEVGQALAVTGSVRNSGTATAPPSQAAFQLSPDSVMHGFDPILGTLPVPSLAPQASHAITASFAIPGSIAPGGYFLGLSADSSGAIAEFNEGNNVAVTAAAISVTQPVARQPNLVARAVSGPAAARAGDAFTAAFSVENAGTLDVTATFTVGFVLSTDAFLDLADAPAGAVTVQGLASGARADRHPSLSVPGGLAAGHYFLLLRADALDTVAESSESDNTAASALAIEVTSRPDDTTPPTATLMFSPGATVTTSSPVTITATFSEPLAVTPSVQLASTGGRLLGGSMTRVLDGSPAGAEGRLYRFAMAAGAADNGAYTVSLQAADAAGNALVTQPAGNLLTIAIIPNRPPVANAGPDRTIGVNALARLEGSGSDPDGESLTFAWTAPQGVTLANPASPTPSFTPATAAGYLFTLRVTDGRGAWSEDSVVLTAGQVTEGLRTDSLVVSGIVRFESGELPPAGSRVRVTNPRTGNSQLGEIAPESGFYRVSFTDAGGDAAAAGDALTFQLLNPDGTDRAIARPQPPSLTLVDDAIALGSAELDLTGTGGATSGAVLETLAGNGTAGFAGDAGQALAASLNGPSELAFDQAGTLYVADTFNCRVRRVSAGVVSTVAGNGKGESSGDTGPATAAGIGYPAGLAAGTDGKLFVSDRLNNRVRRVDLATGVIATVAGSGTGGFAGDGSAATAALLSDPRGLALRGTQVLLIADTRNNRIRELNLSTGLIRTVAGTGVAASTGDGGTPAAASFNSPAALAVDSQGRVLVAELLGHRVRRLDLSANTVETVAGTGASGYAGDGGPATQARLFSPVRLAARSNGDLLIADRDNQRLRLVEARTGLIRTLAGTGTRGFSPNGTQAERASIASPQGLALAPGGDPIFSDTGNHRVRRLVSSIADDTDDHPDTALLTGSPQTLAVNGAVTEGSIERGGDVDFFRFTATPGFAYTLRTELKTLNDTVLTLFDRDGTHVLGENDDAGGLRASRLEGFRPREGGTYFARVRAFQSQATGTYALSLAASALSTEPQFVTTGLPEAVLGQAYGTALEMAGGTAPYRFTQTGVGGALPPGLTLDAANGLISGTPGAAGDFRFAVAAKDANQRDASKSFVLTVRQAGQARYPESAHPYAASADEAQSYTLPGNPTAINVTFDDRTVLEAGFDFVTLTDRNGTPVSARPFTGTELAGRTIRIPGDTVRLRLVSDPSVSQWGYRVVNVTEAGSVPDTLVIAPNTLPGAKLNLFYSARLSATAGVEPLQWSLAAGGSLPQGINLDTASGVLSGLTTAAGDFAFTVKARDSSGAVGSRRLVLPVFSVGGSAFPESLHPYADAAEDVQSYTLEGNPPAILVTFDERSSLESGFDFLHVTDGSGAPVAGSPFSGTDLAGRTLRVPGATVRLRLVSDGSLGAWGYLVKQLVAVPASPAPLVWQVSPTLPGGRVGQSYSQPLTVTGGVPPYRTSLLSGRLPPGLFLDLGTGRLSGAPTASGTFSFRLEARDSAAGSAPIAMDFGLGVAQATAPELGLTAGATTGGYAAELRLATPPEPLSRITLFVAYDAAGLASPSIAPGAAAGAASVSMDQLAAGLLRIVVAGPPNLTQGGIVASLGFEVLPGANPRAGSVTVSSSEFVTAEGLLLVLRPSADAGLQQSLRAQFVTAGVLAPTIPDPVAPAADNLRPYVRLDGRESADPNRPPLPLTYSWTQTAGTTVVLSGARTAIPTFVPPRAGEYRFALTVANPSFESPAAEVAVAVDTENSAPSAEALATGAGSDGAFVAGRSTVVLDGTYSTDPDPLDVSRLRYYWRQTKGHTVTLLDAIGGAPSSTASRVKFSPTKPGRVGFELVVSDPQGAASPPDDVDLLVRPENLRVPALSLISSASTTTDQGEDIGDDLSVPQDGEVIVKAPHSLRVKLPTRVTLKASVADDDVGKPPYKSRLTFAWSQTDGPAVKLDNSVLASTDRLVSAASFEPTTSRVHVFECRVSKLDENGTPTGIEVARQVRVIVDSNEVIVPEAAFDIVVLEEGVNKRGIEDLPATRGLPMTAEGSWEIVSEPGPAQRPGDFTKSTPRRVYKVSYPRQGALYGRAIVLLPGAKVKLDGGRSTAPPPKPSLPPPPLQFRWVQTAGPRVVLSNPFSVVTQFVVPNLVGDPRSRQIKFSLFVDNGRDRSEPVEGGFGILPPETTDLPLPVRTGLNMLSVPLDPSTTGHPFNASDLLTQVTGRPDQGFVVRVVGSGADGSGPGRFDTFHPGLTTDQPFVLDGNEGYLVFRPSSATTQQFRGRPWTLASRERNLRRGLNLLALPSGVPEGYTAEDLRLLIGAPHVSRVGAQGRFETYLPGLSPPFPIERGTAYLFSLPSSRPVTLPVGP